MNENNRLSTLPLLEESYSLTQEQIASYQKDGHLFLKNVASAEMIKTYEPIISDLVFKHNYHDKRSLNGILTAKLFIQVGNLWEMSEAAAAFTLAKRFAKIAAELMGVEGVRIYHDQALFKEPGGGHTPWHQDQIYWPFDTNNTITLWMPLVPIPEEVGTMNFASGTNHLGYVSRQEISDESHKTLGQFIEGRSIPQVNYGAMAAGDATFHAGWTIHSAPGNPTDHMRKVMTIIYYADGTLVGEPDSKARRSDLENWLPGCKPGGIAASIKNPLVYKRENE